MLDKGDSKSIRVTVPFNKPYLTGGELQNIAALLSSGNISAGGHYTRRCEQFLEQRFGIPRVLMTPSCTAALEMAAILCDIGPGDEIIMPSYTFVSTANAFVLRGATPVFVDIRLDTLNLNEALIENAITDRTKAICPVHYAGVACEMDAIREIATKHDLFVIEDAAQGVNAFYKGNALGSIGDFGTFSFHDTKNYICGEGGALCINDERFVRRAEIIHDKGTNRRQFYRGDVDKYTWCDIGSSYVLSELNCAFLAAQLDDLHHIFELRSARFQQYASNLVGLEQDGLLQLPSIPGEHQCNFHMFYVLLHDQATRNDLMAHLGQCGIHSTFHYVPLHLSPMGQALGYKRGDLPATEDLAERLLRLPFFSQMSVGDVELVTNETIRFLAPMQQRRKGESAT